MNKVVNKIVTVDTEQPFLQLIFVAGHMRLKNTSYRLIPTDTGAIARLVSPTLVVG